MSQEYGLTSEDDFHAFFNVCEDILHEGLNPNPPSEDASPDFEAFFKHCEDIIHEGLESEKIVQAGCGLNPGGRRGSQSSSEGEDEPLRFNIVTDVACRVKRFNMEGRRVTFHMSDPPADVNPVAWFREGMEELINHILRTVQPSDQVGLVMNTPQCELGPAWISFRRADQIHIDVIWDAIAKILQSNAALFSSGNMEVVMTRVCVPVGTGNSRRLSCRGVKYADFCRRKYGIIEIDNSDNLCLPRALVIAKAITDKNPELKRLVKNINNIQDRECRSLICSARVNIPGEGCGIPELVEFQRFLFGYNIVVYQYDSRGTVVFEGNKGKELPRLNLLNHEAHYSVIKSLTAAFSTSYFCEPCHTGYNQIGQHRCERTCPCCQRSPPCQRVGVSVLCKNCDREFRDENCFKNHLNALCRKLKKCTQCFKTYVVRAGKVHACGMVYCKTCDEYKSVGHECYIKRNIRKKQVDEEKHLFLYFDFETRQERSVGSDKLHEVNLCVVQQSCPVCADDDDMYRLCESCGIRQHIFNKDPVADFVEYATLPRRSFKSVTCIAHNGKGFDFQFILCHLTEVRTMKPKLIMNGTKIMLMEIDNVRFIDSINFLPMSLSSLVKALDLPPSIKKGYFPHLFNTLENSTFVGPIPPTAFYGADSMHSGAREQFMKWHSERVLEGYVFDMEKEIVEYCISDVDILRRACIKFRCTFLEDCGVCPLTESVTIASACNKVFRRRFLKSETIGLIPENGYRMRDNQSRIALEWLLWEEEARQIRIQHAARGSEAVLEQNMKVDGYFAPDKLVFEFYGCYYHGHDLCFRTNRNQSVINNPQDSLNSRLERTMAKAKKLRELGYTVVEKWECEFNKEKKDNKQMRDFVENHFMLNYTPLEPRAAFFGGRTGNCTLYRKTGPTETIRYVDVCSLYPWVCKYGKFPVGHPKIFVGSECSAVLGPNNGIDSVEGLIKCLVLPPNNLLHPILPRRSRGKLMFVLCCKCCDEECQTDCTHSDDERQFSGTWVADELRRAVQFGYKILQVFEIWRYEVTVYDKTSKTGGLFVEYIDTFLKIKQEATGYPAACVSTEDRQRYVQDYAANEGVELDHSRIEKNAGRRSLAKLMLNSFWGTYFTTTANINYTSIYLCVTGKFAQSENKVRTSVVTEPVELFELLENPAVVVNHLIPAGEKVVYVNWKFLEDSMEPLATVNVSIAAYTTAQARLRLLDHLQPLGSQVLYYDTDSVIYSHAPGQYEPPTGNFLGDLTDELECYGAGSYITEFVCGGPKNYAYRVYSPTRDEYSHVCKVKGFTLNYANSQVINFNAMKDIVLSEDPPVVPVITSNNIRCSADHSVVTRSESKKFNICFTKRRRVGRLDSVPYGHKKLRLT